jgi:phage terminase large subunit-like protein
VIAKYPGRAVLIEDKANGPAVISALRDEISGIIAVDP